MATVLYAKDNAGNVLVWDIQLLQKKDSCSLSMIHGHLDGAKQTNWEHNIVGVNVGRKNETTPFEQAESRLKSRVNRKKQKGYVELLPMQTLQIDTAKDTNFAITQLKEWLPEYREDAEGFQKPMMASQYFRSKSNWTDPYGVFWKNRKYFYLKNPHELKEEGAVVAKFPMYGQPKVNGVRAFLYLNDDGKVKLKSKEGLTYHAPSHVLDYAQSHKKIFMDGTIILDGELYIHGESLQIINSAVKAVNMNTPRIVFIVFDVAIDDNTNRERWTYLKELFTTHFSMNPYIELIRTYIIRSDAQTQETCDRFIELGYEGIILRNMEANYHFGSRKVNMLKLKRTISEDFTIIKILPQPKRPDLALFLCSHKGKEFKVTPTFDETMKAHIMSRPMEYLGKKLQTTFYEWTDAMKPLHVIETVIRDYE